MKAKKVFCNVLFVLITVVIITAGRCVENVSAASESYVLQDWYLVDSGKHLDWDGSTNYMREWYAAVNTWNAYKPGVIRVDTWKIIQDVKIKDKSKKDGVTYATTYQAGTIVFYQDTMDEASTTQRQATITHEIGHALGLDHNNISDSIMRQGKKKFTTLHKEDKAGYDASIKRID